MNRTSRRLTAEQILLGYRLCLQNAGDLQNAALPAARAAHGPALALAQIAQEEVGKSMLLMCAYTFTEKEDWREFWKRWTSHDAKANAAAWYEWIDALRMTVSDQDGRVFDGLGFRARYSDEKEAGLYVDFDDTVGGFVPPSANVSPVEAMGRIMTAGSLLLTAGTVHDAIFKADADYRMQVMSTHVRKLWDGFVTQEEMADHLAELGEHSEANQEFIQALVEGFAANRIVIPRHPGSDGPHTKQDGRGSGEDTAAERTSHN
jgi:AbiV family abortive infection protein